MAGVLFSAGSGIFLLVATLKPILGPTQLPIQWVQGIKLSEYETDRSLTTSAELKNTWSYSYSLPYILTVGHLMKHMDNFIICAVSCRMYQKIIIGSKNL
jgi:hypothetical protein